MCSDPLTAKVFTEFSPFDVSCFDQTTNTIFIDEQFQDDVEIVTYLTKHELLHAKSKKLIDFGIDMTAKMPKKIQHRILKKKPLFIMAPFMPLIYHKKGEKWDYGIDFFRLILLCLGLGLSYVIVFMFLGL